MFVGASGELNQLIYVPADILSVLYAGILSNDLPVNATAAKITTTMGYGDCRSLVSQWMEPIDYVRLPLLLNPVHIVIVMSLLVILGYTLAEDASEWI